MRIRDLKVFDELEGIDLISQEGVSGKPTDSYEQKLRRTERTFTINVFRHVDKQRKLVGGLSVIRLPFIENRAAYVSTTSITVISSKFSGCILASYLASISSTVLERRVAHISKVDGNDLTASKLKKKFDDLDYHRLAAFKPHNDIFPMPTLSDLQKVGNGRWSILGAITPDNECFSIFVQEKQNNGNVFVILRLHASNQNISL